MSMKHVVLSALLSVTAAFSSIASATVIMQDEFGNSASTLADWTVTGGNLDFLTGSFWCGDAALDCIDMEGTQTSPVNTTISRNVFLTAGDYAFEFMFGNNDAGPGNTLIWSVGSFLGDTEAAFPYASTDPHIVISDNFTVVSDTTVTISFAAGGPADNSGPILDYVTLTSLSTVPAPATLALVAFGLVGVARARRPAR